MNWFAGEIVIGCVVSSLAWYSFYGDKQRDECLDIIDKFTRDS